MFYCTPCAEEKGWPLTYPWGSRGKCEVCNVIADCNDTPSKYLPVPKPVVEGLDEAIESIKRAAEEAP